MTPAHEMGPVTDVRTIHERPQCKVPCAQCFCVLHSSLDLDFLRPYQWEAAPVDYVKHHLLWDLPQRIEIQALNEEKIILISTVGGFLADDSAAHHSFEHIKDHRAVAKTDDVCWH